MNDSSSLPSVSIVIPAYNSAATLSICLEAALAQDYPREKLEVIVVDDGSTDNSADIAAAHDGARLIRQTNGGPAKARNTGWKAARGDLILFTDSDCVAASDWARTLAGLFSDPKTGGAGGTYDIQNKESLFAKCVHEEIVQRHANMREKVNYLGSFNVAYRRGALEETGGFDESFPTASGEDNDLSYRINKQGYHLRFDRRARVAHFHPDRLGPYLKSQYRHGFWRMKLYRIHPDMMSGDAYGGPLDLIQPPMFLLSLALLPVVWTHWLVAVAEAILLLAGFALQIPFPAKIVRRTGKKELLWLSVICFFRSFARGLGMARGILRFGLPRPTTRL